MQGALHTLFTTMVGGPSFTWITRLGYLFKAIVMVSFESRYYSLLVMLKMSKKKFVQPHSIDLVGCYNEKRRLLCLKML